MARESGEEYMARQRANRRAWRERQRSPVLHPGPTPQAWKADAACRGADPELFFPASPMAVPVGAVALCATCGVHRECLAAALANQEVGVWAGLSRPERDRLRAAS